MSVVSMLWRRVAPLYINVKIYPNQESILRHFLKHQLAGGWEGRQWARVLKMDGEHWRQLARLADGGGGCQKIDANDVCMVKALRQAYLDAANLAEKGMNYAAGAPLYARVRERLRFLDGRESHRETYYFISKHGVIMVVSKNILRTMYFSESCRGDAFYDMFQQGVRGALLRARTAGAGRRWFSDTEGAWVEGESAELISPENFQKGFNPWPRPARPKPFGDRADRRGALDYIGKYTGDMDEGHNGSEGMENE